MKMAEKVNCTTLKKMIERLEKTLKASNDKLDLLHSEIMGMHEESLSQQVKPKLTMNWNIHPSTQDMNLKMLKIKTY